MCGASLFLEDDLAALSMAGAERSSAGLYTPDRVDLTLTGASQATDLLVYAHEAHHQALNDSTAWGAALHVLSALSEPPRACFAPLLDVCRVVHEAYATFAAVSIVAVHYPDAESLLAPYPNYERLYRSAAALTADAAGPHRRYLLATALARVSMQSPVLAAMLASDGLTVAPSDLRTIDLPDARWRWLTRAGRALTSAAAAAADDRVATDLGTAGLSADVADGGAGNAVAEELDSHWETWERAAYDAFAKALGSVGATVLAFNGHMEPSGEVVERARALDPALPVRAARPQSPAPNDAALSGATIQFVRLNLVDTPRRARLAAVPGDAVASGFTPTTARAAADSDLTAVLHVRLPRRMLDSYRWTAHDTGELESAKTPIVALRQIESGDSESIISHLQLPEPGMVRSLTTGHPYRLTLVTVAGASCFIDTDWSSTWLATLRDCGPLVVLIDIEAARFVGSWVRGHQQITASVIRINDTTGMYWATALRVGEDPAIWLHLGDELTVKLLLDQLRGTSGLLLDVSPDHIHDVTALLTHLISHLLATESFLDLLGLDPDTISRVTDPPPAARTPPGVRSHESPPRLE